MSSGEPLKSFDALSKALGTAPGATPGTQPDTAPVSSDPAPHTPDRSQDDSEISPDQIWRSFDAPAVSTFLAMHPDDLPSDIHPSDHASFITAYKALRGNLRELERIQKDDSNIDDAFLQRLQDSYADFDVRHKLILSQHPIHKAPRMERHSAPKKGIDTSPLEIIVGEHRITLDMVRAELKSPEVREYLQITDPDAVNVSRKGLGMFTETHARLSKTIDRVLSALSRTGGVEAGLRSELQTNYASLRRRAEGLRVYRERHARGTPDKTAEPLPSSSARVEIVSLDTSDLIGRLDEEAARSEILQRVDWGVTDINNELRDRGLKPRSNKDLAGYGSLIAKKRKIRRIISGIPKGTYQREDAKEVWDTVQSIDSDLETVRAALRSLPATPSQTEPTPLQPAEGAVNQSQGVPQQDTMARPDTPPQEHTPHASSSGEAFQSFHDAIRRLTESKIRIDEAAKSNPVALASVLGGIYPTEFVPLYKDAAELLGRAAELAENGAEPNEQLLREASLKLRQLEDLSLRIAAHFEDAHIKIETPEDIRAANMRALGMVPPVSAAAGVPAAPGTDPAVLKDSVVATLAAGAEYRKAWRDSRTTNAEGVWVIKERSELAQALTKYSTEGFFRRAGAKLRNMVGWTAKELPPDLKTKMDAAKEAEKAYAVGLYDRFTARLNRNNITGEERERQLANLNRLMVMRFGEGAGKMLYEAQSGYLPGERPGIVRRAAAWYGKQSKMKKILIGAGISVMAGVATGGVGALVGGGSMLAGATGAVATGAFGARVGLRSLMIGTGIGTAVAQLAGSRFTAGKAERMADTIDAMQKNATLGNMDAIRDTYQETLRDEQKRKVKAVTAGAAAGALVGAGSTIALDSFMDAPDIPHTRIGNEPPAPKAPDISKNIEGGVDALDLITTTKGDDLYSIHEEAVKDLFPNNKAALMKYLEEKYNLTNGTMRGDDASSNLERAQIGWKRDDANVDLIHYEGDGHTADTFSKSGMRANAEAWLRERGLVRQNGEVVPRMDAPKGSEAVPEKAPTPDDEAVATEPVEKPIIPREMPRDKAEIIKELTAENAKDDATLGLASDGEVPVSDAARRLSEEYARADALDGSPLMKEAPSTNVTELPPITESQITEANDTPALAQNITPEMIATQRTELFRILKDTTPTRGWFSFGPVQPTVHEFLANRPLSEVARLATQRPEALAEIASANNLDTAALQNWSTYLAQLSKDMANRPQNMQFSTYIDTIASEIISSRRTA